MEQQSMTQYRTEQELLGQGFSRESLDAIRSTGIETGNRIGIDEENSENNPQIRALQSQFNNQQKNVQSTQTNVRQQNNATRTTHRKNDWTDERNAKHHTNYTK